LDDLVFNDQMSNKAIRDAAPLAITVVSMTIMMTLDAQENTQLYIIQPSS